MDDDLADAIAQANIKQMENKHKRGYERMPVSKSEFSIWKSEQEELTVSQLESILSNCEIIEEYSNDPRGESCLVLGFLPGRKPVHIVCGKNPSGHLILITVYIPAMPK